MEKEIIIVHESLLESWAKDAVSFGGFFFLLIANYRWLGNHASVAVMFVILLLVFISGRSAKNFKHFYNKDDAKKFIDNI